MTYDLNANMELLEKYIDGTLSTEEKERVELLISSEPEWEQTLRDMQLAVESVRYAALNYQVAAIAAQYEQQQSFLPKQKSKVRMMTYVMRAAAVAIVIVASYVALVYSTTTTDRLFNESYVSYELITTRSNQAPANIDKLYAQQNWKAIIETVNHNTPTGSKELFLAGIASMNLGQYEEAANRFRSVMDRTDESNFLDDAEYYLALSDIKLERYEAARNMLRKIQEDPSHKYHSMVKRMQLFRLQILEWKK